MDDYNKLRGCGHRCCSSRCPCMACYDDKCGECWNMHTEEEKQELRLMAKLAGKDLNK